jgi:plasmid stabilization system protein ParE
MVIVWNVKARNELKRIYEYILKDSYQNAIKVRNEIVATVLSLPEHPERHPSDKYKINNDGTWRAFEIYHYRISYRITNNEIRIVRLRHTSRSPLHY